MEKKKKGKRLGCVTTIILVLICFAFLYSYIGLFVIQPIGAIPDGVTIVYKRWGTSIDFVESPDVLSKKIRGNVSLLTRMIALSSFMKSRKDDILFRLPYFESLYLITTDSKEDKLAIYHQSKYCSPQTNVGPVISAK